MLLPCASMLLRLLVFSFTSEELMNEAVDKKALAAPEKQLIPCGKLAVIHSCYISCH